MGKSDLKKILIRRISEIDDISFLNELNSILENRIDQKIIKLTQEQLDEIAASKKEIEQGVYIDNKIFKKEVKEWLRAR
jgi:hypothetical protein